MCGLNKGVTMKKYVSYFQSVITVGVMKEARNKKEAEAKAKKEINHKDMLEEGFCHCSFSQTPFSLIDSEEWIPEIETTTTKNGLGWKFCPNNKTRTAIANKMSKSLENLTDDDIEKFIKSSIEENLKKA